MTWEETIQYIRTKKEYDNLVFFSYLSENLVENVQRFKSSEEFKETLEIIKSCNSNGTLKILDVGSGNGISAISFALQGYIVTALEPDKSETVGAGAIEKLKKHFNLNNLEITNSYAEDLPYENESYDIVYVRQAFHHANNLQLFVNECARVLKPNGLLMGIREHVIFNEKDKEWFLKTHPLQKFYFGENAYSLEEYTRCFINSKLKIRNVLTFFDSIINYFPYPKKSIEKGTRNINLINRINSNLFSHFKITNRIQMFVLRKMFGVIPDEKLVPGRMYSFILSKT